MALCAIPLPRGASPITFGAVRHLRILDQRAAATRSRVAGDLAGAADLPALAARAAAALDAELGRAEAATAVPPACTAGCWSCCHVHVEATVPEILLAAGHLARSRSPEALAALREDLAAHARRVEPLDDEARWAARIPCALLDARGLCSLHEARPLRCRAFHSASADPCRAAFAGPAEPAPEPCPALVRAAEAVERGYDDALAAAGLPREGYRFEIGLLIALDDPAAGDRWREGQDAFARARPR
jgi:Fe-S-cluster containining protein